MTHRRHSTPCKRCGEPVRYAFGARKAVCEDCYPIVRHREVARG